MSGEAGTRTSPVTGWVESETASARPRRSGIESPVFREDVFKASLPSAEATWVAAPLRLGRSAWDSLFTLLFPVQCRVCEQPLEVFTTAPVCADCLASPQPYQGIECFRCGRFLSSGAALRGSARQGTSYCGVCRRNAVQRDAVPRDVFAFEQARSFGAYEGTLQSLIQRLKYDGYRPLAKPLGRFLAEAARRLEEQSFDLVIPVPLHPRRQRQRGFNQAALLAAEVSKFLNIPSGAKDCVRVRDTRPQTGLRAAERRKNVAGAFDVPEPERVRGRRVLLIDDVLTTGATAHACAQALRKAGARGVWVGTLARAHPARDDVL